MGHLNSSNLNNSDSNPDHHSHDPDKIIGDRYQIKQILGQGSFGATYLVQDLKNENQLVAMKRFYPEKGVEWKGFELFEREAQVLRSLQHHGIPGIHNYFQGEKDNQLSMYLVMDYIPGKSLATLIDEKASLDQFEIIQLMLELLNILHYLHSRIPPLFHRDLKPANIIIRPDGSPALVDFGAVRSVFKQPDEKGSTIVGTYGYMPFEQYMGQACPASDLYSLGATMLHLMTNRPPADFIDEQGKIIVPDELPGGDHLREILVTLLRHEVSERFQSALEVRQALLSPIVSTSLQRVKPENRHQAVMPLTDFAAITPRPIEGSLDDLYTETVLTPMQLMNPELRATERTKLRPKVLTALGSVISLGLLPAIHYVHYLARKKKYIRYFKTGVYTTAELINISRNTEAGAPWFSVTYRFWVDGEIQWGKDKIIPSAARFWKPGDQVHILYLPVKNYASVIIGPFDI
ncbi:serine/threonine protein kinase [candidate division CSSED10-310 bacterium]|uniref:non-specific serine/threonine protein kinase n=1 Tax=candidate division CSSED10-310 bacterium TaxID=2855610 RepID=A0ABV6Z1E7_UNCC1